MCYVMYKYLLVCAVHRRLTFLLCTFSVPIEKHHEAVDLPAEITIYYTS